MNNLDEVLKTQTLPPKRTLHRDFTQGVLKGIQEEKHIHWTSRLFQRLRTKLGLTIITGILLVGGTAAASGILSIGSSTKPMVIVRPAWSVTRTLVQQLSNGGRVIGYDQKNCDALAPSDGTTSTTNEWQEYLEVRKDSPITNSQLQSWSIGNCEQNIIYNTIADVYNWLPANRRGETSAADRVVAISAHSVTVSLDPHYNASLHDVKPKQKYTRFNSDLAVYDQSTKKSNFSTIHVGDDIVMITKDTSGIRPSKTYSPFNHPKNQVVEAILKVPPLTGNPDLRYTPTDSQIPTDSQVFRVEPCTTDPTGFCPAYQVMDYPY